MTEIRVGAFVLAGLALLGFAWAWTYDGVRPGESAYRVNTTVTSADGLWLGTPVRVAGVEIGSVAEIALAKTGTKAQLALDIRSSYPLPEDSVVELRSAGMLGDRYVAIVPGKAEEAVKAGATLSEGGAAFDMDAIGRQAQELTNELQSSAEAVGAILRKEETTRNVEQALADLAELTKTMASIAARNQRDIDAMVAHMRHLSEVTDQLVSASSPQVQQELDSVQEATERLNAVLENLEGITQRMNEGEGTIGALLHERELIDKLDATLVSTNEAMQGVSGVLGDGGGEPWKADVWTTGRVFVGGEGVQTGGTLGGEIGMSRDMWVSAELIAPPQPLLAKPRASVQAHRRWGPASVHAGMKESAEGIGGSLFFAGDRVRLQADAFDFLGRLEERPAGMPNLRLGVRAEPLRYLWVEAAAEEVLLGIDSSQPRAWFGLGVHVAAPARSEPEPEVVPVQTAGEP